ncbi:MAG: discoidin domain-containing protein [Elusimicrobia bacterium]|nr:discoidin domain-containing protein [Elusimicrobiota bacterium]
MKIIKFSAAIAVIATFIACSTVAHNSENQKSNIAFHKQAFGSLYQDIPDIGDTALASSWSTDDVSTTLPSYDETAQLVTDGIIPDINNIPDYPVVTATNINGDTSAADGVSAVTAQDVGNLINGQSNSSSNIIFHQNGISISDKNPLLINFTLPTAEKITKYSLIPRFGQNANESKPYAWKLQASDDGKNYVDIDTFESIQSPGYGTLPLMKTKTPFNGKDSTYYDSEGYDNFYSYNAGTDGTWGTFGVQRGTTADKAYKYYRLYVTQINSADKTGDLTFALADISLFAENSNGTLRNALRNPFISRWKSTANESQWVYVDLGENPSYDTVKLYWGNDSYPTKYRIQVSDDVTYNYGNGGNGNAQTWTDVAEVTKKTGGTDTVKFKKPQTARYVRFLTETRVQGSSDYKLYEFEVYGTSGASAYKNPARPPAEADGVQQLTGGDWKIARAEGMAETGEMLSQPNYDDAAWIPAKVPGTALKSYIAAGIIPDTNFDMNMMQVSDTYFYSDFWYRTSFDVPAAKQGQKIFLNFDAISWKAKVYVNGNYVDMIEGSFARGKFDISKYVNYGGQNELAVLAVAPMHYAVPRTKSYGTPNNNGGLLGADNPSIHASIGWDWAPVIRGRNTGIYDKVYLSYSGDAQLADPWVATDFNLAKKTGADSNKYDLSKAKTTFRTEVKNISDKEITADINVTYTPGDIKFSKTVVVPAGAVKQVEIKDIIINNPQVWWPNTYGAQPLYTAQVQAVVDGKVSDTKTFRFGVRKLDYTYTGTFKGSPGNAVAGDSAFNVYCNGVRIYLRGGNWGMDDSNVDLTDEDYRVRVKLHALENFTMIRDWVGQTGKEAFWNACDEYGILVYDDFWLSNPWDGTDPLDQKMFMDNVTDKIKKVRKHPSEALYCARNEGVVARPLDTNMQNAIKTLDGTRAYVRASNNVVFGINGNGPYTEQERKQYYNDVKAGADFQLHTERGQHVIANPELYKYYFRPENIWPGLSENSTADHPWRGSAVAANTWGVHDFFFGGNGPAGNFMQQLSTYIPLKTLASAANNNIETFAKYTQMPNYDLHRAMFEGFVEKKGSGLLMWMSLSAWPSFSWRSFDYFYDTSAAYFGIKKAGEPLSIIWNPTNGKANTDRSNSNTYNPYPGGVAVANNTGKVQQNLKAVVKIFNMDAKLYWSQVIPVKKLAVDEVKRVINKLSWPAAPSGIEDTRIKFLKLELYDADGALITDNLYWRDTAGDTEAASTPDYTDLLKIPAVDITASYKIADLNDKSSLYSIMLKNTSDNIALQIRIKAEDSKGNIILPVYYSDNYVTLLPGEEKEIKAEIEKLYFNGAPKFSISGFNVNPKAI